MVIAGLVVSFLLGVVVGVNLFAWAMKKASEQEMKEILAKRNVAEAVSKALEEFQKLRTGSEKGAEDVKGTEDAQGK